MASGLMNFATWIWGAGLISASGVWWDTLKVQSVVWETFWTAGKYLCFLFFLFSFFNAVKQTLCVHGWINCINKLTLKDNMILFYFVYMWRTLPPFWLQIVFWGPYFLWEKLVYSLMEILIFLSLYYHLMCLNFFFKTICIPKLGVLSCFFFCFFAAHNAFIWFLRH